MEEITSTSLDFTGVLAAQGEGYNEYYRVDEPTSDKMYSLLKDFWTNRRGQDDERVKKIVLSYRESNLHESWKPVREKLIEIQSLCPPNQPFSMIDLGGANGSAFYVMKEMFPDADLRYFLVEPCAPFIEDFLKCFPDQQAVCADAEQLIALDDDALKNRHYTLFFASLVLCMIKPSIVKKLLKRMSEHTDQIVLADNIMNVDGHAGKNDSVIFDYYREGYQWYFSHYFRGYFDEIGFDIVDVTETLPRVNLMKRGFGVIHARRR